MATAANIRAAEDEERLLRVWTPVVLRLVLIGAVIVLLAGLVVSTIAAPGHYIVRFHELQRGENMRHPADFSELIGEALSGSGRATMTLGLMILTLVPIGRVTFTFLVFLKQRDYPYVAMTGYVLAALIIGATLGRIG